MRDQTQMFEKVSISLILLCGCLDTCTSDVISEVTDVCVVRAAAQHDGQTVFLWNATQKSPSATEAQRCMQTTVKFTVLKERGRKRLELLLANSSDETA